VTWKGASVRGKAAYVVKTMLRMRESLFQLTFGQTAAARWISIIGSRDSSSTIAIRVDMLSFQKCLVIFIIYQFIQFCKQLLGRRPL